MSPRIGVVVFPGTNCEHDTVEALQRSGADAHLVWHDETSLAGFDAMVLPGGFAHGDYLRTGAIARFSPVMSAVEAFAGNGGPVLGICNGFQILCEAGLLPGALVKNTGLKFICSEARLRIESTNSPLTATGAVGRIVNIPINHFEGCFTIGANDLKALQANDQVVLRYLDNPNGAADDIAGVCNEARNVVGLMPHPERASSPLHGSTDGSLLLGGFVAAAASRRSVVA